MDQCSRFGRNISSLVFFSPSPLAMGAAGWERSAGAAWRTLTSPTPRARARARERAPRPPPKRQLYETRHGRAASRVVEETNGPGPPPWLPRRRRTATATLVWLWVTQTDRLGRDTPLATRRVRGSVRRTLLVISWKKGRPVCHDHVPSAVPCIALVSLPRWSRLHALRRVVLCLPRLPAARQSAPGLHSCTVDSSASAVTVSGVRSRGVPSKRRDATRRQGTGGAAQNVGAAPRPTHATSPRRRRPSQQQRKHPGPVRSVSFFTLVSSCRGA